ncbi:MAG: hypothetical protein EPO30_11230 [Lysobacteraceae bacterium]|nr:MAG: hypothetical protein EPO30_11230 [Xanthomonadaceae bacterium]
MRKRLMLLWTPIVLALALLLPSSTLAVSYGKITLVSEYCSGQDTINATFKVTKYSGFYAYKLTITAKGQEYWAGSWHNAYNIGTWTKVVDTYGSATFKRSFWYNPANGYNGRIVAIGKIWGSGGYLIASGKTRSGYC